MRDNRAPPHIRVGSWWSAGHEQGRVFSSNRSSLMATAHDSRRILSRRFIEGQVPQRAVSSEIYTRNYHYHGKYSSNSLSSSCPQNAFHLLPAQQKENSKTGHHPQSSHHPPRSRPSSISISECGTSAAQQQPAESGRRSAGPAHHSTAHCCHRKAWRIPTRGPPPRPGHCRRSIRCQIQYRNN